MPLRTLAMLIARAAACVLVVLCLSSTASAASLDDWRNEVVQTRQLADNDAKLAYRQAQRLETALPAEGTPVDRVRILNVLARIEIYLALTSAAASHVEQALDLAKKSDDKVGQVEADLNIALNSVNQGRINTLVKATTHSMTLLDGIDRPELVTEAMLRTATMYGRAGAFDASMTLPMQAMDIAQRSNNPLALVYAHEGMAIALEQIARWNEAAEHYALMRDQARAAHSRILEAEATQGIGDMLTKQGRLQEGESLIRGALATYRDFGGPFYTAQALFSLAANLMTQKRPDEALALLDEVLEIYEKNSNKIGLWSTYSGRSNDYLALGRIGDAARDAQRAYDMAAVLGAAHYEALSARQMASIAAVRGEFQTAYKFSTEADQMKELADADRASARMLDLAQRYRTEAKQHEIDQLTRDAEQHAVRIRWLWTVFGSSVLLLAGTVIFLSRLRLVNRHLETVNTQLARSQNKLRATLDALPDVLFELGLDGRYYDYHSPRTDLLAVPVDGSIGKNVQEILPPAAAAVCTSALVEANETGKSFGKQFELALPHGHYWFELSVARKNMASSQEPHFIVLSRDITERKRMENLLHVREQEFRAMVENSPDIVVRYDTQCRRIYVNPAMQRQFGLSIDKILGSTPLELSAMTGVPAYMQRIQSVLKSAQETQMEFSFRDPQGGEHWGHMRLVPEFNSAGEVVSVLAITRDISERKRVEEALEKREREFRTLAESIPDNIVRYDLHAHRTYLNSTMARTLGMDATALIGTSQGELNLSSNVMVMNEYSRRLRKVLKNGESDELEMPVYHAEDGMQVHNVRFVAERDAQGKTVGVLAIGRDITAQKVAEDALLEREQRYREIFDNASDGLYLLEVTEDGRFRNLDVNPTFERSTGMGRDELIGKYVDETVSPEVAQTVMQKYRRCIEAGTAIEEQIELDLPVGRRYFDSTLVPISNAGRICRIVGISRDVTKLKQIEHDLEESRAQLRGLTARREQVREEERKHIAREVHDELGQILTGLKLNISIIEHKYAATSAILREHLRETILLIDRSLEVARNVASTLRPAALDLGIVSALEWLAGRFELNTGIRCEMIISDVEIHLDEDHEIALFRIVQESLTNIARYAKAHQVFISLDKDADDYIMKVRDNGVGFDASTKKFNSFGLVGIRERALMLGGSVVINSTPGKGTEIIVRIPNQRIAEES